MRSESCLYWVADKFNVPERPVTKPLRVSVSDVFKGTGSGFCVAGRVETGMVQAGDKVLVLPQNETALVKCTQHSTALCQKVIVFNHDTNSFTGLATPLFATINSSTHWTNKSYLHTLLNFLTKAFKDRIACTFWVVPHIRAFVTWKQQTTIIGV